MQAHPDMDQAVPAASAGLSLEDSCVIAALEDYQAAVRAGRPVSRQQLLERFPAIAADLEACLEGMELLLFSSPVPPNMAGDFSCGDELRAPLGEFRLIRELGRGGMGVVYEAEQLSLNRRVALKVLPFAATLDPRQLQRFKHEAHAAASLQHPHIVPVHAVGCDRGVHYYAMQYIEGQTLAAWIWDLRRQRGLPGGEACTSNIAAWQTEPGSAAPPKEAAAATITGSDSWRGVQASEVAVRSQHKGKFFHQVAALGLHVAQALEYAHEYGVIHRDIKPANLLLDRQGKIWITDFGLARLERDAGVTVTGDLVGTVRYMSPEQALGKRGLVDHRTDVYSLGATLYELLTLEPACPGSDRAELLQQIAFHEPCRPRHKNKAIPADLETIVLKALAKDPAERYATAGELAADLGRFLDGTPIHARSPSLLDRLGKLARRHRSIVAGALALLLVVTAALGISNYWVLTEQANTRLAYAAEAEQRAAAERSFQQAQQMLDFFTEVTEQELADHPEVQETRRKLLAASLAYYQDFIEKSSADSASQKALSRSHFRVAAILHQMGDEQQASAELAKASDILVRLLRSDPKDEGLRDMLEAVYQHLVLTKTHGVIQLLREERVQKEIKLSSEQKSELLPLLARHREMSPKTYSLNPQHEKLVRDFDALTMSIAGKITATLEPAQARRLDEIALQRRGSFAFKDTEVVARLHLSRAQQGRINWIIKERFDGKYGKNPFKAERETLKAILNVLTATQKDSWQRLTGAPFLPPGRLSSTRAPASKK
jgi:serine/threonine protein kinase